MRRVVPGKFPSLAGIVNATFYKTEPIFTDLGHDKMSLFLTLIEVSKHNGIVKELFLQEWSQSQKVPDACVYIWSAHGVVKYCVEICKIAPYQEVLGEITMHWPVFHACCANKKSPLWPQLLSNTSTINA